MNADLQQSIAEFSMMIKNEPNRERTLQEKAKANRCKKAFANFSQSGWIPDLFDVKFSISFIEKLTNMYSISDIDSFIYEKFVENNYKRCRKLLKRLKRFKYENPHYYNSFLILYKKKEYLGCCMMILALIEQKLRSKGATPHSFGAFMNATYPKARRQFGIYRDYPKRFLLTAAGETILQQYFQDAGDFRSEPNGINRNYLMHGVTTREYSHKDCIKLLCFLNFICTQEQEGKIHVQSTP